MVKHTQTIRRHLPMNCLIVFDHFIGLAFKGIRVNCGIISYLELSDFDIGMIYLKPVRRESYRNHIGKLFLCPPQK